MRKNRIIFTPSEEMYVELDTLAAELNKPMAAIIREAIADYLKKFGRDVDAQITWGGKRGEASAGLEEE
jgi:predicted DNA-binding protein